MKKRFLALLLLAALPVFLTGCETVNRIVQYNFGPKGITEERQAEVDAIAADYAARLTGPTWWHPVYDASLRFLADGRVEEDGLLSEPGDHWAVSYSEEYENMDLASTPRIDVEKWFDFYLHYDSPLQNRRLHVRLAFNEDGNPILGKIDPTVYTAGPDYIHEVPADAVLDPYFTQTVWGDDNGEGGVGALWILWEDGWGAETVGAYQGELIYPSYFHWSCKDDLLFIDWYVDEGDDRNLDIYRVERGELNFYCTPYLDRDGSNRFHMIPSGDIDITAGMLP